MNSSEIFERAVSIASKEFVRGFVIGQVVLFLLLVFLARLLLFRGGPPGTPTATIQQISFPNARRIATSSQGSNSAGTVKETCIWLNGLLSATILSDLRHLIAANPVFINSLSHLLSLVIPKTESIIGPVKVSKLQLGEADPQVKWIRHASSNPSTTWWIAIEWVGTVAEVDIDTTFTIYWPPKNPVASLPCAFTFVIRSLFVILELKQPTTLDNLTVMARKEDFQLDLEIHSLIGHRTKLKDIPKLTSLLQEQLRRILVDRILEPHTFTIPIENLGTSLGEWLEKRRICSSAITKSALISKSD